MTNVFALAYKTTSCVIEQMMQMLNLRLLLLEFPVEVRAELGKHLVFISAIARAKVGARTVKVLGHSVTAPPTQLCFFPAAFVEVVIPSSHPTRKRKRALKPLRLVVGSNGVNAKDAVSRQLWIFCYPLV